MAETPITIRQTQILAKIETTSGTYQTLAAADGGARVHTSPEISLDMPMEDRPIARSSMTQLGKLTTTKAMGISFRSAVNTPDVITADPLEHKTFLRASGHTVEDLKAAGLGAIASGPFTRGETVTDDSGNTARVIREATNGDDWLYHDPITGTLQNGENITGSASGATCTLDVAVANHGYQIKPISDNQETCSLRKEEDGEQWTIAGAMSNLNFTAENSKPCYFDFAFVGPYYSHGAQAMTTGISYETEKPPKFQGAGFTIDGVSSIVVKSVEFNQNSEPVKREDANTATTGIVSMYKADRGDGPKLTVSLEMPPSGTLDILGDLTAESTVAIKFNVGTVKGKSFMFFADYAQVESIGYSDSDGIRTLDVVYVLTGAANGADDEYEIIYY